MPLDEIRVPLSGVMAPTFYGAHYAAWDETHNEIWLKGGRGSGKSSFISLEIVMGLIRDPKASAIIYRKVADTLRDSVYAQMVWALDKLGASACWQYKVSPMEIVCPLTGQRIIFRGADNPEKSKGLKLQKGYFKYLWFEELPEFRNMEEEVNTIKASVIRGADAITFYSYNPPKSAVSWTNKEALKPRRGRFVHESTYLDMPRGWLGEAFIAEAEALRDSNELAYRHMYLGEVTGTGGRIFNNVEVRPILPAEWQGLHTYSGHDFGFAKDPDAFVRCAYDKRQKTLYIVDEFTGTGMALATLARKLKKHAKGDMITADSGEPRSIAELKALGVRVIGAKKGPDSVGHGMRWLENIHMIVIDREKCPVAAQEFMSYEYDRDRAGQFISRYPDRDNHTIDATRYALESLSGQRIAIAAK